MLLSFGRKYINYLDYVITGEEIKPDTNKVKVTKDIGRTTTMTEALALISMVQCYR